MGTPIIIDYDDIKIKLKFSKPSIKILSLLKLVKNLIFSIHHEYDDDRQVEHQEFHNAFQY